MPRNFKVAIVGRTGHGDYGHAVDVAWLEVPNAQVVAVADDDKAGLGEAARRLKVDKSFTSYEQMLDEVKPDIVSICQRWVDQHAAMILAAVERGIHVYMEKPFVRNLQEADQVVEACERKHVKLAIAHPTHYSPKLATIRRLIAEGKIGTVLEYRARGKEDGRGGAEDMWVLGSHMFDVIRVLGGHPSWCFARVSQKGQPITKADVVDGNEGLGPLAGDGIDAMFGMPDGSTAYFSSHRNMQGKPPRYSLRICGSGGIIEILEATLPASKILIDSSWSPGRSGAKWQDLSSAGIDRPEPLKGTQYESRHLLAIADFLQAIEEDRQPQCGVYDARGITEMILAVFESQRIGGPVTLPLENRVHPLTML